MEIETTKVLVYEPTVEWTMNGNDDYRVFSGNISSYYLDGTLEDTVAYLNGTSNCKNEPCPDCPTNPNAPGNPHGPGNGGGGGTSGGGSGTPGGGGPTNGGGGGPGGGPGNTGGTSGGGTSGGGTSGGGTSGGGTSGGGTSGGGTSGGGTSGGGTSGGGTSGGGGGGGGQCQVCDESDDYGNCIFWHMEACTSSFTANRAPANDCDKVFSGGVVITTQQDPCTKIKTSTNDSKYKANITTLQGKTGDSYESGFRLGNSVAGSGQTGTQNQVLQNKPGTTEVDMKIFSNTFALMHSHYDGLFPIFSPGDILLFNQWVVWANSWNAVATNTPKISLNNLTLTLVTSNGNYLIAFDGTATASLPAYTPQQFDALNKDYEKRLNATHTNGNFDMSKVEKEFLKFVKDKMNMTGLKLYKVKNDGNYEISLTNLAGTKCP